LNLQIAYPFWMRYVLGFDGGGTKTECVLMNSADQVLARTFSGPSNPSRIGVEAAVGAIEESAELALRDAGLERSVISAVGAGLAGTAKADMRERTACALRQCFPGAAAITVLTDLDAALAAAGEGAAIILVAGTGSAAFGRNGDGEIARSGGYGPSSSDEGSAYDIGRRAIAAAMQERGGSDSALGREILAQLGCTEWGVVQHRAQTMPDEIFPTVFPVVAVAADAGDAAAQEILVRASQELVALVADVAGRLQLSEREFLLVRMGGTIGRSRFFDAHIDAALKKVVPQAQIGKLRVTPAEAAALIAKESDAA
jgi:N-acetylglucosamine kinase-like BadF-type ATPase